MEKLHLNIDDENKASPIGKAGTINAKTDRNINIGNDSIENVKQILNDYLTIINITNFTI